MSVGEAPVERAPIRLEVLPEAVLAPVEEPLRQQQRQCLDAAPDLWIGPRIRERGVCLDQVKVSVEGLGGWNSSIQVVGRGPPLLIEGFEIAWCVMIRRTIFDDAPKLLSELDCPGVAAGPIKRGQAVDRES